MRGVLITVSTTWNADAPWRVHPQVSVRPEPFGALLYHFGTRQLSFIKDPALAAVLVALPDATSARAAMLAVAPERVDAFSAALETLARKSMIIERAA